MPLLLLVVVDSRGEVTGSRSMASGLVEGKPALSVPTLVWRERVVAGLPGGEAELVLPGAGVEVVGLAVTTVLPLCVRSCCFMLSLRVKALWQVGQWTFFSPVCFLPCRAAWPEVVNVSPQL